MSAREVKPVAPVTPVTERGRATRRALLDAAEAVFEEFTYDRAAVSEITRRAGVAQGTFYVYFPDKEAAFVELVRDLNHDLRRTIAEAVEGISDRLEMERVGLRVFFDYITEHRALYKLVREAEFVDEEVHRWHYRTLRAGYARGLRAAQAGGQIAGDIEPETLSIVLMGIAEFLGAWAVMQHQPPSDAVFEQVMTFIRRGMGYCEPEDRDA